MIRRGAFIFVTLLLLLAGVGLPPAYAACNETSMFLSKPNYDAYGTAGNLYAYNHDTGTRDACGQVVQTQLIVMTSDAKNFVEVGYQDYACGFLYTSECFKAFGEWGFYPATKEITLYSNITPLTSPRFKVFNVAGTFDWRIQIDTSGGQNYTTLDTYCCLWSTHGTAIGEVSRLNPSATAENHEWNLWYIDSTGTARTWSSITCWDDTLSYWQWVRVSNTEFKVTPGPAYC